MYEEDVLEPAIVVLVSKEETLLLEYCNYLIDRRSANDKLISYLRELIVNISED